MSTYSLDDLEAAFNNIAILKDKRKIMLSAFRKAMKPTAEIMWANAPVGKSGNLQRSMGLYAASDEIAMYAGARIKGGFKGFHAHLIEEGTVDRHYTTKEGNEHFTGKLRYSGFIRSAAESGEQYAIDIVAKEWYKAIGRYLVKHQK